MNLFSFFKQRINPAISSKYNGAITIETRYRKKAVVVNNVTQSGGEITYMWKKVISDFKKSEFKINKCLILGIGGGDVAKLIKQTYPQSKTIGVEIDRKMIETAKEYFSLDAKAFSQIYITDAVSWIKKQKPNKKFDLIVVDLFIGSLNPKKARQKLFLTALSKLLNKNGVILYNSDYQEENSEEFERFKTICKSVFINVEEVFHFKLNRLMLLKKLSGSGWNRTIYFFIISEAFYR